MARDAWRSRRWHWLGVAVLLAAVLLGLPLLASSTATAHDPDTGQPNWITSGRYVSPHTGVHCCGPKDCERLDPTRVEATPRGLILHAYNDELVPYTEATPSEDQHYWRCHGVDRQRRCFFAPVGSQ